MTSRAIAGVRRLSLHPRLMPVLKVLFLVAALALGLRTVLKHHTEMGHALETIGAGALLASAAIGTLGVWFSGRVWTHAMKAFGATFDQRVANRVFFTTQTGKYLPGLVWPYIAQMRFAKSFSISKTSMFASQSAFLGMHLGIGGIFAGLAVPWLVAAGKLPATYLLALLPAALAVIALHPRVFAALIHTIGRGRRAVARPDGGEFTRAAAWMCATWLCYGLSVLALTAPLTDAGARLVAVCLGGFALSWIVGFLVVVSPAGVGAREVALTLCLGSVLTPGETATVVLASRILLTLSDLGLGLGAALLPKRSATEC